METFGQDLRYGARLLIQRPVFTLMALLTLGVGVGVNTAIFSVVNALLIRPLPYSDPGQLVVVFSSTPQSRRSWVSYHDLQDWRAQAQSFSEITAFAPQSVNLTGIEEPVRVRGGFVSSNFLNMLGVEPTLGRGFLPGEDAPGGDRVVVLNDGLWRGRYGGDPEVLGQKMILNGEVFTIVGVMPDSFRFEWDEIEVWIPFPYFPNFANDRRSGSAGVIARMKPGVGFEQARAEMETVARRLAEQYPDTNKDRGVALTTLRETLVEDVRPSLLVLLAAVIFVLLIACANVGNLLLSRAVSRQKELALRAALGATRGRIIRQLLTEAALLSVMGGALGLLLGWWGTRLLVSLSPGGLPGGAQASLDATVFGFTLAISLLSGIVFGLAPALKFSRPDLIETLKEGGRASGDGAARNRVRAILVVSQVGLAMVLLIGSGLMIKSLRKLVEVDPGFDAGSLLTLEYRLPRNKYPEGKQQWEFHRQVVERVRSLPGVRSAALVRGLPFSGNGGSTNFVIPGRPEPPSGMEPRAQVNLVDSHYFDTLRIPLLKGRAFNEQDHADSTLVAVVNQSMLERFWPDEDPTGKQIRSLPDGRTITVIGVVGDVKQYGLDDPKVPQIYGLYAQSPIIFATLAIRTEGDPMSMAGAVRDAVWSVDRDQPMWKVRTMESLLENSVGQRRFILFLLGGFSALALLLAAVGIYGVISYLVTQRTHEIGVRMALGAERKDIMKMVLGQGMALTLVGVAAGLGASFALTRFLTSLLFSVSPTDLSTFTVVPLVLVSVAVVACFIPARRATKVDPMVALRYE
jgi:putative ABC transport system permease protein